MDRHRYEERISRLRDALKEITHGGLSDEDIYWIACQAVNNDVVLAVLHDADAGED